MKIVWNCTFAIAHFIPFHPISTISSLHTHDRYTALKITTFKNRFLSGNRIKAKCINSAYMQLTIVIFLLQG